MVLTGGLMSASFTDEMGTSTTDSERVKIQETTRLCVGEERKSPWSLGERILRDGTLNVTLDRSGGSERPGLSGVGRVFDC